MNGTNAPARLGVLLDGEAMPEEEARAFWGRFSAWMDERKGDLSGFAKSEGLLSVHPTMQEGRAVLVASRSAPQKPYTNAPTVKTNIRAPGKPNKADKPDKADKAGGSTGHQAAPDRSARAPFANGKSPKK
jgi:hypothetical protein